MELADDIDSAEAEKVRFLLKSRIKKKILNTPHSVLKLFIYMEQEGLLGIDKLDLLANVMETIRRPELLQRVQQAAGTYRIFHELSFHINCYQISFKMAANVRLLPQWLFSVCVLVRAYLSGFFCLKHNFCMHGRIFK